MVQHCFHLTNQFHLFVCFLFDCLSDCLFFRLWIYFEGSVLFTQKLYKFCIQNLLTKFTRKNTEKIGLNGWNNRTSTHFFESSHIWEPFASIKNAYVNECNVCERLCKKKDVKFMTHFCITVPQSLVQLLFCFSAGCMLRAIWSRMRYRWRCNANREKKTQKDAKMLNYQIGEYEKMQSKRYIDQLHSFLGWIKFLCLFACFRMEKRNCSSTRESVSLPCKIMRPSSLLFRFFIVQNRFVW